MMSIAKCLCGRSISTHLHHHLNQKRFFSVTSGLLHIHLAKIGKVQIRELPQKPVPPDAANEDIIIPKRKKRNSLSVLKALASTVNRLPDAPHYKFIDDPYLLPQNALDKKEFALSRASGQKTARYVLENYPRYFGNDIAIPSVKAFNPEMYIFKADIESEEGLAERIEMRRPLEAYESYVKIQEAGKTISDNTHNDLLDLLCFYNCSDVEYLTREEQFYLSVLGPIEDRTKKFQRTWKRSGSAEKVFEDMKVKNFQAYKALILGACKYHDSDSAMKFYEDMKNENHPVDADIYRAIISSIGFIDLGYNEKWKRVRDILQTMRDSGVAPTLATFNAVLLVLERSRRFALSPQIALSVLKEMQYLGIEPSLRTYTHLLQIIYFHPTSEKDPVMDYESQSPILKDIVRYLKGKELTLQDPLDRSFFLTAMIKNYVFLKDVKLAYAIDELLNTGENRQLVQDYRLENNYYTYFMKLMLELEPLERVMDYYTTIVPHVWVPTIDFLTELVRVMNLNDTLHYLPIVYRDSNFFGYLRRVQVLENIVGVMAKRKEVPELQEQFLNAVLEIKARIEEDMTSLRVSARLDVSGDLIGHMIMVCLSSEDVQTAWDLFYLYSQKKNEIEGTPSEACFIQLTKALIADNRTSKAAICVTLMYDLAYPTALDLIKEVKTLPDLRDSQRESLDALL